MSNLGVFGLVFLAFLSSLTPLDLKASSLFKPATAYPSGGTAATSVAVADLNGDGKLDVIVSNYFACSTCYTNGSVGILLGNGDGTFQTAQTYDSGGSGASQIAVADINGDGKLDVVVANACAAGTYCDGNSNTGSVAILLGNGDGTFQPAQVYSSGNQISRYLVLGDFNDDGKLDVVVADGCGGCGHQNISVLLGNGQGGFQSAQSYDLGAEPIGITAGDVNGDGKLDIAVGLQDQSGQTGSTLVLLGNGDGTFSTSAVIDSAGAYPLLVDLNGDGRLDLLVTIPCANPNCAQGGTGVLLGNGDATFQPMQIYSSGGSDADFVATGDVNRDGKVDVVVANYSGSVGTLLGTGSGLSAVQVSNPAEGGAFALAVADVNNDGKPDVLVAIHFLNNESSGGVAVLLNDTFWATRTALTSSPNPSVQGQRVKLTARVGTQGSIVPTGEVVFKTGGSSISVPLVDGSATLITANLSVGSHPIEAQYQGDLNSAKSTSTVIIQLVNPAGAGAGLAFRPQE